MIPPAAALLLALPPLLEVAEADPVAVVHVPDLGAALSAADATAARPLVRALVPAALTAALGASGGELVAAIYKGSAPGSTEASVWLDGAAAEVVLPVMREFWRGRGYAAAEPDAGLEVWRRGPRAVFLGCAALRCAYSERRAHVAASSVAAARPLGGVGGEGLARLRVDVAKVYGLVARSERGARTAGIIRRLGLDGMTLIEGRVVRRGQALVAELALRLPQRTGLVAALAPASGGELPAAPGSFLWANLSPRAALVVAEKLASFLAPLETTLVSAQLDAVEAQRGRRLDESFGAEARLWLVGLDAAPVLWAGAGDAGAAAELVAAFVASLPAVIPELALREEGAGPARVTALAVRGRPLVAVGRRDGALVVAASSAAVQGARRLRAGGAPPAGALAGGVLQLGAALAPLGPGVAAAADRLVVGLTLSPRGDGLGLALELRRR